MLVDENASDVELFRFALGEAKLDCELLVIGDGAEALAFVRQQGSYARSGVPDLIVPDLQLPKSDGIEILDAVTHSPPLADVPVTVFSSGFTPREITRLRQFHGAHSMAKSSCLDEFLQIESTLKRLLSETRTNG